MDARSRLVRFNKMGNGRGSRFPLAWSAFGAANADRSPAIASHSVMDLLRRIAVEQNAAIIVVTHDEMILDRFDHIYRLRDGRLES